MFRKQGRSEELPMGIFRFLARVMIGLLFVGHGTQKLFGWFGGGGPRGDRRDVRLARAAARSAQRSGGRSRRGRRWPAVRPRLRDARRGRGAVQRDDHRDQDRHWEKGIWTSAGGYEYNLVLLATVFGLTESGPGRWSVDGALGKPRWGTAWALAALAAGAAGSAAALAAAKNEPPAASRSASLSPRRTVRVYDRRMCRNIHTLFNFEPPATDDEVRDASLQYVRKISGFTKPSQANEEAFALAVDEVAAATRRLVDSLVTNAAPRTARSKPSASGLELLSASQPRPSG